MEIATMINIFSNRVNNRVIADGVKFVNQHGLAIVQCIRNRAKHLWYAAQGVIFLYLDLQHLVGNFIVVEIVCSIVETFTSLGNLSHFGGHFLLSRVKFNAIEFFREVV